MLIDPISRKLLDGSGGNGIISLMYHSITPSKSKPAWEWALSRQSFCDQLSILQDFGWTTLCANSINADIKSFPTRTVLITFDDGYADNMAAFEQLVKRNMKASWFVVSKDIGQMSSWTDKNAPTLQLLDQCQLIEMQEAGMEIGSHTHSHVRLTEATQEQVNLELNQSKNHLSGLLNKSVTSLAYPYGLYNQEILSATRTAGYTAAFTTNSGFGLVNNNLFEIRRVSIKAGDSLSTFARKLAFADNDVGWSKLSPYLIGRIKSHLHLS